MTGQAAIAICPHGRTSPAMCPHCLGVSRLTPKNRLAPGQQLLEYQRQLAARLARGELK